MSVRTQAKTVLERKSGLDVLAHVVVKQVLALLLLFVEIAICQAKDVLFLKVGCGRRRRTAGEGTCRCRCLRHLCWVGRGGIARLALARDRAAALLSRSRRRLSALKGAQGQRDEKDASSEMRKTAPCWQSEEGATGGLTVSSE